MIAAILHGAARPSEAALAALRARLALAGDALDVREAFDTGTPTGAAARVAAAARDANADLVVALAVTADGRACDPAPLVEAARQRSSLVLADDSGQVTRWVQAASATDLVQLIADDCARVFAGETAPCLPRFVAGWAAPRAVLPLIASLDAALLHVGDALDLALRCLEQGVPVECLPVAGPGDTDVYPLGRIASQFLAWRNAQHLALRRADTDRAGRCSAWVTAQACAAAWRAAAVDPARLRFGGDWGRRDWRDTWSGRAGIRRNEAFWPADETATAIPLLAMDAAHERLVHDWRAGRLAPPDPPSTSPLAAEGTSVGARSAPAVSSDAPLPRVSVIVVNWNGEAHLDTCFSSILASDYPADRLQVICVDNGSQDGSRALLATRFPSVQVVALDDNRGFTGGNLAGVAAADGDVLVFFNNDMRIAPGTVRTLVAALDGTHPCVSARVLNWEGTHIDFVRGSLSFEARGFQEYFGEALRPELTAAGPSFFANGGAFAITRAAYEQAGGFDQRFFAYYEDTDLGWGVRLNGGAIRVVDGALVHHRGSATGNRPPEGQKKFLMERNAVWAAAKRYEEGTLARTFGPLLLLAVRRIAHDAALERGAAAIGPWYDRAPGHHAGRWTYGARETADGAFLRRVSLESVAALGEAMRGLPEIAAARRVVQSRRRVPDARLLPAFGRGLEYLNSRTSYREAQDALVARFGLDRLFRPRTRVLIVTHDPLRANMSGPGVRVLEMGRALASSCEVTIASPFPPEISDDRCRVAQYTFAEPASMGALGEQADVIVVQGFTLLRFPILTRLPAQIVVDLYCPFTIEHLEMRTSAVADAPGSAAALPMDDIHGEAVGILDAQNQQLEIGDFFLCASERQRDFWAGALQTAGRVNPLTYAADPTLRGLIDVVPFGLPDGPPPPKTKRVMKGALPGIGPDDQVMLWAGSLLDWQDPQGLIRAVARLAPSHPRLRLVFMGTRHPNPDVPLQRAVEESMRLSDELGLTGRHVFFNTWVPYAERHEWLLEADLGVSTHRDHLETRLAYRTRMLDYLWCGLPVVCTAGDVFADLVEQRDLGVTAPPGDVEALAAAIAALLGDAARREGCRARLREVAAGMRWSQVVAPLRRFCLHPRYAADRAPGKRAMRSRLEQKYKVSKWLKRTALRVGISEGRIEQIKQVEPVRRALIWRNRIALARAQK